MDATISAVSAYKTDKLEEVDLALSSDRKDFDINSGERLKTEFQKQIQEKYIDALVTQLKDKLADVADLEPFSVFDPSKLPTDSDETFKTCPHSMAEEKKLISTRKHYFQSGPC